VTPSPADPRSTPEFQAYLRAREAVLRMKEASATESAAPSAYWVEELDNIDYLADASPLIIRKLRHHAFHITGIRPYDYRVKHDGRREHFEARLRALEELGGSSLRVPEAPALGGFGYLIDGRLYNVDTLKFYEVLIGMERGGLLAHLRDRERPVVCEIGPGWGGFAYQLKTLFPKTACVLVDLPDLFLFSATYLATLFPDARLTFLGTTPGAPEVDVAGADFIFVPNTLADVVSTLALDLMVNMVSFQEMTDAQVRTYARLAAEAGCPFLYSLNRERSPYNEDLVSVSEALSDRYQLTEVPVLETEYTAAMKKPPKRDRAAERTEFSYRHYVGRLDRGRGTRTGTRQADADSLPGSRGPRVVLGMTLYNNAAYLVEALESLLSQTYGDFVIVMLDDGSSDGTEEVATRYTADPRIRYHRHDARKAMIATWRRVVELAAEVCPSAEFFAWVSDHDRWHPRWLERLVSELDRDPQTMLAYPITRRLSSAGEELEKGPRLFDTADCDDLQGRWRRFCREGVGSGDMVYGLVRLEALRKAGTFRSVLRPDRLLMAELTLQGRIRQVPEVLWYRRRSEGTSVERQRQTLVRPGDEPNWFHWPPWIQHSIVLWREYGRDGRDGITSARWARMILRYQLTYGWRHLRKTETSHALGRGVKRAIWGTKMVRHYYHHAVYNTLVGGRKLWGRARRLGRRGLYEVLVLTHRLGLRRGRHSASP
jgi:glycosyltransferase involved in cell wall biosynthesis